MMHGDHYYLELRRPIENSGVTCKLGGHGNLGLL